MTRQELIFPHRRRAFGIDFASAIALPEMTLADGTGEAEVEISLYRDPDRTMVDNYQFSGSGGEAELVAEGIRYRVSDGRRIAIDAPGDAGDNDIRLWLTGSAMAILLFQRGLMPIHANLVRLPSGGVAAFAGDSGAGKSTLAAALDRAGFEVLGDDLCAVALDGDGRPQVHEGLARVKLWRDALERAGGAAGAVEPVATGLDKFHVATRRRGAVGRREPMALERVYLLDRRASASEPVILPVGGAEAASIVLDNAFRWEMGQAMLADEQWQFERGLAIARHATIARFRRTFDLGDFDAELETLAAALNA